LRQNFSWIAVVVVVLAMMSSSTLGDPWERLKPKAACQHSSKREVYCPYEKTSGPIPQRNAYCFGSPEEASFGRLLIQLNPERNTYEWTNGGCCGSGVTSRGRYCWQGNSLKMLDCCNGRKFEFVLKYSVLYPQHIDHVPSMDEVALPELFAPTPSHKSQ
jgi:hypothetical protein